MVTLSVRSAVAARCVTSGAAGKQVLALISCLHRRKVALSVIPFEQVISVGRGFFTDCVGSSGMQKIKMPIQCTFYYYLRDLYN